MLRAVDRVSGEWVRACVVDTDTGERSAPYFVQGDSEASVRAQLTEMFGAEWGTSKRFAVVDEHADPSALEFRYVIDKEPL